MKNKKRILALTLAGTLLFSQGAAITYADTASTAKEEVVYANLAHDGSLSDVHVVNSFDGGSIITGFALALRQMGAFEKGIAVFTSPYGYSNSGSGSSIPGYAPLIFEIELVAKPEKK